MLKEKRHIFRRLNIALDGVIAGISFILAVFIRCYMDFHSFSIAGNYSQYLWLSYIVAILWPLLLDLNGIYPVSRFRSIRSVIYIIIQSSMQGLLFMLAFFFASRMHVVSRLIVLTFSLIVIAFLILKESLIMYFLRLLRKAGANTRNVLMIGTPDRAADIMAKIEKNPFLGLKVVGLLVPKEISHNRKAEKENIIGTLEDTEKILNAQVVDSVVIALDRREHESMDDIIFYCQERGIEICIVPDIFNIKSMRLDLDDVLGIPLLTLGMGPRFSWQLLIKGIFDRACGLILLIVSLPIMLVAAFLIKITSEGPAIFKQIRCGSNGREFTLYKLRTMLISADQMKKKLWRRNVMKGPVFKIDKDPRVTPIGYYLRRFSVDEMPQFWNVVKGDMSIVGPRPPIPEEVKRYKGWQRRRLSMKPGMTGLWQVEGRNEITDFSKLTELDLRYIDNWSLLLDIWILFKTIWAVLSARGAK